jgi:hypothetical protein
MSTRGPELRNIISSGPDGGGTIGDMRLKFCDSESMSTFLLGRVLSMLNSECHGVELRRDPGKNQPNQGPSSLYLVVP